MEPFHVLLDEPGMTGFIRRGGRFLLQESASCAFHWLEASRVASILQPGNVVVRGLLERLEYQGIVVRRDGETGLLL